MRSHLLYGDSHCKIKKGWFTREGASQNFSGSVRHWAGFFIKEITFACWTWHVMLRRTGKKSLCFYKRHWRLLIDGWTDGREDRRNCLLASIFSFYGLEKCGGIVYAFMGRELVWNGMDQWQMAWQ